MSIDKKEDSLAQANRWSERLVELGIQLPPPPLRQAAELEEARALIRIHENELNCIYSFTQILDREHYTVDEFMSRVVDVVPAWWQYPEVACARIVMGANTYRSLHYTDGPAELVSHVTFPGEVPGYIAIVYGQKRPAADEGPFLTAERKLLNAVANRLVRWVALKHTNAKLAESRRKLELERTSLREANTALRLVLDRIEEERNEAHREVLDNTDRILMPIIRELEISVAPEQKKYVELLKESLGHITSPFTRSLTSASHALTTTEIQICNLIRDGMGSKQIADLRGTSVATIHRHREHIRQKLGITNRKVNLASYLRRIV